MTEISSQNPTTADPHAVAKTLMSRGLIVYHLLAGIGILHALLVGIGWSPVQVPFGPVGALALAGCFLIAPRRLRAGSDGWRSFTQLFGLFLALVSLGGGVALANSSTIAVGAVSLVVFLLACYLVRVFGQSMEVAAYMAHLRQSGKKHGQKPADDS